MADSSNPDSPNRGDDLKAQAKREAKRPIPLALMIAAALGWLLFFVALFWRQSDVRDYEARLLESEELLGTQVATLTAERDGLDERLVALEETSGDIEVLRTELVTLTEDRGILTAEIEDLTTQRDAVLGEVEGAQVELAAAQEGFQSILEERDRAVTEADQARADLELAVAELATTESRITTALEELNEVGARLETVRAEEAQLRGTVATLTEEAARLAEEGAQAESNVQRLREEEADLIARLETLETAVNELLSTRSDLETETARLEERREALSSDVTASEELRSTYQAQVEELASTLAARGEELSEIEQRISALVRQDREGRPQTTRAGGNVEVITITPTINSAEEPQSVPEAPATQAAPAVPATQDDAAVQQGEPALNEQIEGRYEGEGIVAVFRPDGTFEMENERGQAVIGRYTASETGLRFDEAEGNTRMAQFPMNCDLARDEAGFTLAARDESCRYLDGVRFDRAR